MPENEQRAAANVPLTAQLQSQMDSSMRVVDDEKAPLFDRIANAAIALKRADEQVPDILRAAETHDPAHREWIAAYRRLMDLLP